MLQGGEKGRRGRKRGEWGEIEIYIEREEDGEKRGRNGEKEEREDERQREKGYQKKEELIQRVIQVKIITHEKKN